MRWWTKGALPLGASLTSACDGAAAGPSDAAEAADLAPADKAAACASTFGTALTPAFGRLDGQVRAVVAPAHPTCARPNGDHLVLQLEAGGEAYRMVVNVQSTRAGQDPRVRFLETSHAALGAPFAEGWHPGEVLDYVSHLGVHRDGFTPVEMSPLVDELLQRISLGKAVSVFATSSGGDSAHLVHRNTAGEDGAIVLDPLGPAPRFLLLAFDDQGFGSGHGPGSRFQMISSTRSGLAKPGRRPASA